MKIERIHAAILTLDSGEKARVERIGRGRYSTAWSNGSSVYVQTHEDDHAKEILSRITDKHLPQVEFVESTGIYNWYKMPLYQPLKSTCKRAWADFKALKQLRLDAFNSVRLDKTDKREWDTGTIGRRINESFQDMVDGHAAISAEYSDTIRHLVDWCATYGEGWLIEELQPRNCVVDPDGNLILLDPIFDLCLLRQEQNKRLERAY